MFLYTQALPTIPHSIALLFQKLLLLSFISISIRGSILPLTCHLFSTWRKWCWCLILYSHTHEKLGVQNSFHEFYFLSTLQHSSVFIQKKTSGSVSRQNFCIDSNPHFCNFFWSVTSHAHKSVHILSKCLFSVLSPVFEILRTLCNIVVVGHWSSHSKKSLP